jgi:hypothetical protein
LVTQTFKVPDIPYYVSDLLLEPKPLEMPSRVLRGQGVAHYLRAEPA